MNNETQDRIKTALEEVLTEFGLEWEKARARRHNALEFFVNGIRLTHVYSSGGSPHRAHFNAKSELRNRLRKLGLEPKIKEIPSGPPELLEVAMPDEDMMPVEIADSQSVEPLLENVANVESVESVQPPETEQVMQTDEPMVHIMKEQIEEQTESAQPDDKPTKAFGQPIPMVRGHVFQSPKVLAIKVEQDLIIDKGRMLIIPLNKPGAAFDMTEEQFRLIYDDVIEPVATQPTLQPEQSRPQLNRPPLSPGMSPPPLPSPKLIMPPTDWAPPVDDEYPDEEVDIPVEFDDDAEGIEQVDDRPEEIAGKSNDINDIIAYLQGRRGAVKSKVVAQALGKTIKSVEANLRLMINDGIVNTEPGGFYTISPSVPLLKGRIRTSRKRAAQETGQTTGRRPTNHLRGGPIQPQVGRILAAMIHAARSSNRNKSVDQIALTGKMVTRYLDARDSKQVAARMGGAIASGWVKRGDATPERGFYHYVTMKAVEDLKNSGTYAYDADGLPIPPWYHEIFE